jgi:hypothetical protein
MKPNKENIVNEMLLELEKGTTYSDCMGVIGLKWSLPPTTFTRYWKTANEKHAIKQEAIQKELLIVSTDSEKERLKTAIFTKDKAIKLLVKIAKAKDTRDNDKINAVKTISEMEGWKAPNKTEHSGEIKGINLGLLPTSELIERAKVVKKIDE